MARNSMHVLAFIFVFVASFTLSKAKISEDYVRSRAECQIEVQFSDISLAKKILKQPIDDPKVEQFGICILKKIGSMDANGKLQIDNIRKAAKELFGAKADEVVEECAVEKPTVGEAAVHLIECWVENVAKYVK